MRNRVSCFSWNAIKEIRIMPFGANESKRFYETVLVCFLEPTKDNTLDRIAGSEGFAAENMDKILVLSYDPILLEEIQQYYSGVIPDDRPRYVQKWKMF